MAYGHTPPKSPQSSLSSQVYNNNKFNNNNNNNNNNLITVPVVWQRYVHDAYVNVTCGKRLGFFSFRREMAAMRYSTSLKARYSGT